MRYLLWSVRSTQRSLEPWIFTSAWLLGQQGQTCHTSRCWEPSVLENGTCVLVLEKKTWASSKTWPPPWVLRPCKHAHASVLTSLHFLCVVEQGCVEYLWPSSLAQASAKPGEAELCCVGRPEWLTRSVVNRLCLLLSLHPANTAVITELYFLDTWK